MRDIVQYTKNYKESPFEKRLVEIRKKKVIEIVNKYSHAKIAEIGCGESPFFMHYNDFQKIYVIEPSLDFYNNAKNMKIKHDGRITLYHGYAEDLIEEINNANVDFIILSGLLHEVENPKDFLCAIKKMCSSNTILHINVPNAFSVHRILAKEMGLITNEYEFSHTNKVMMQHSVFSLKTLKECVAVAGFSVLDEGSYFIKPFTHTQMERCLSEGILPENILLGLCRLESYMPGLGAEIFVNCAVK
jgi:ubiquinone/menaquinone biosynthesis C-methylase UbiE